MIDPKNRTNRTPVHESMPKGVREFGEDVEKKSVRSCSRS